MMLEPWLVKVPWTSGSSAPVFRATMVLPMVVVPPSVRTPPTALPAVPAVPAVPLPVGRPAGPGGAGRGLVAGDGHVHQVRGRGAVVDPEAAGDERGVAAVTTVSIPGAGAGVPALAAAPSHRDVVADGDISQGEDATAGVVDPADDGEIVLGVDAARSAPPVAAVTARPGAAGTATTTVATVADCGGVIGDGAVGNIQVAVEDGKPPAPGTERSLTIAAVAARSWCRCRRCHRQWHCPH